VKVKIYLLNNFVKMQEIFRISINNVRMVCWKMAVREEIEKLGRTKI
jgi:hypothetical protein